MTECNKILLNCLADFRKSKKIFFDTDAETAEELIKRADEHKLVPILYLTAGESLEKIISAQRFAALKSSVVLSVSMQAQRTAEIVRICKLLEKEKIRYIVFKGAALRALYSNSDYRISSDEDLLVKKEDMQRASALLIENGYEIMSEKDGEIKLAGRKVKFLIELHSSLVGSDSDEWEKTDALLVSQLDRPDTVETGAGTVKTFSPTFGLLSLFVHLFNHFVIGGVGIRQVMDIACYIGHYSDEIDFDKVFLCLSTVNAEKFAKNVINICSAYFGLDMSFGKADDELLDDFLCAGIYGSADTGRRHSGTLTKKMSQGNGSFFANAIAAAFPSDEEIVSMYPEMKNDKKAVMAYRIRRIKSFAEEKGKLKTFSYAGKRKRLMKKLGIQETKEQ